MESVKFPLNSDMNREGRDKSRVTARAESRVQSREVTMQIDYTRFYTRFRRKTFRKGTDHRQRNILLNYSHCHNQLQIARVQGKKAIHLHKQRTNDLWKSEFLDSFSPFCSLHPGTLLALALGRLGGRKLVRRGRFGNAGGRGLVEIGRAHV